MKQEYLAFVVALIFLAGCTAGSGAFPTPSATQGSEKTPISVPPTTSISEPQPEPTTTVDNEVEEPDITITPSATRRSEETPTSVTPTASVSKSPPEPSPTIGNEAEGPDVTITGTVMDVSLSARVIMLAEPVEGFDVVALTEESELVFAGGGKATLRDIRPGMRIQASGQAGEGSTLLAKEVLIFAE